MPITSPYTPSPLQSKDTPSAGSNRDVLQSTPLGSGFSVPSVEQAVRPSVPVCGCQRDGLEYP